MRNNNASTSSAKGKQTFVDLDDLALAMHADATFMSDEEYAAAAARLAKRKAIMQPPQRPRLTLTMLGNIILIGVPIAATIMLISILVDGILGRGAGSVAEVVCWLILIIVLLARENKKLRKGLRK